MTRSSKLRKLIPVQEAISRWEKDPKFRKADAAVADEFALVATIMRARAAAGLTQEELAVRMNTTQGAIARLESGTSMPSTRTLRKIAAATGHTLKISLEPQAR